MDFSQNISRHNCVSTLDFGVAGNPEKYALKAKKGFEVQRHGNVRVDVNRH